MSEELSRAELEAAVRARLAADGITASAWSNGPRDRYPDHQHGFDKVLVATHGLITFTLPEFGRSIELGPGDRLDLPAGTVHGAVVGREGVVCFEGHLGAGTLDQVPMYHLAWAVAETVPRSEA